MRKCEVNTNMFNKSKISLNALRRQWNLENFLRLAVYITSAFLINLCLEMLSRRSVSAGIRYLADSPWQFFYDALIILFTLSLSLVFRKRGFFFLLFSAIWLGLGLTNCILLGYRATPLTAPDIWLISSVRDIIEIYMSPLAILGLMLVISAVIGAIMLLWLRAKKYRTDYAFGLTNIALFALLLAGSTVYFLKSGAIASSVGHDSHNLCTVGVSEEDMALAVNALRETGGGFSVAVNGRVLDLLPLPVGGLLSCRDFETVAEELRRIHAAVKATGCPLETPFLQLAFLPLPVIPSLRITDRGIVDVEKFAFVAP